QVEQRSNRSNDRAGGECFTPQRETVGQTPSERCRDQSQRSASREDQTDLLKANAARLEECRQERRTHPEGCVEQSIECKKPPQWICGCCEPHGLGFRHVPRACYSRPRAC